MTLRTALAPLSLAALLVAACASPPPPREVPAVAPTASVAPVAPAAATAAPVFDSRASHAKTIDVPAGSYDVGAARLEEHPKQSVTLSAFAIDATEVTVGDYAECVSHKACTPPRHDSPACEHSTSKDARRAVNCVDLKQARAFCAWVGKRLPTEDEWEGAARAGTPEPHRRTWPCGDSNAPLTCEVDDTRMLESDTSPLGLVGMAGNVSEWTSSVWKGGDPAVTRLITKGDSYRNAGTEADLARRALRAPHAAYPDLGFRCVRSDKADPLRGLALDEQSAGPDLSEAELRERYVSVWKEVFAERQHLSVPALEKVVTVTKAEFGRHIDGTTLYVDYSVKVDWATVGARSELLVRVDPAASTRTELRKLPVDRWLDPTDAAAYARATGSAAPNGPLPLGKHLKFPSRAAAVAALAGSFRATFPKDGGELELARPQWPDKDLYMTAVGTIDEKRNQCLDVVMNLVTGIAVRAKTSCARF